MVDAWIVYNQSECKKNQFFIQTFVETMAEEGVNLTLVLKEDCDGLGHDGAIKKFGLPSFLINRTRDYILSKSFEMKKIKVFNNSIVSEIANDKWNSYLFALECKVPVIETSLLSEVLKEKLVYPQIVKKRIGHGGTDVYYMGNYKELQRWSDQRVESQYIIQKFAQPGKDVRSYVLGKRIVVSMLRENTNDFRANYSLGGTAKVVEISEKQKEIIKRITSRLDFGLVGIDFIYDNNVPFFNELEDVVGSRMVYEKTNINIIREYAHLILSKTDAL